MPQISFDQPAQKAPNLLGGFSAPLAVQSFCKSCAFSESHSFGRDLSAPRAALAYLDMCRDLAVLVSRKQGGVRAELAMHASPACVADPVGNTGSTSKSAHAAHKLSGPSEVLVSGPQNV